MSKHGAQSRKAGALNIIRLARTLHQSKTRGPFHCSQEFRHKEHDPEAAEPLDELQWNSETKRYQIVSGSQYNIDDAILQSMLLLLVLARVKNGWKQADTCAQLSTWPLRANSGVKPQSSLTREWDDEIKELIRTKEMPQKLQNSVNNYNSFVSIYCENGLWGSETRKKSGWAPFYVFTEHSVIQWALQAREEDPKLSQLSLVIIKYLFMVQLHNATERVAIAHALHDIILEEGVKDEPTTFSKRTLNAIERLDLEAAIKSFRPRAFLEQHLPLPGQGNRVKGIYRDFRARAEFKEMVEDGVLVDREIVNGVLVEMEVEDS